MVCRKRRQTTKKRQDISQAFLLIPPLTDYVLPLINTRGLSLKLSKYFYKISCYVPKVMPLANSRHLNSYVHTFAYCAFFNSLHIFIRFILKNGKFFHCSVSIIFFSFKTRVSNSDLCRIHLF